MSWSQQMKGLYLLNIEGVTESAHQGNPADVMSEQSWGGLPGPKRQLAALRQREEMASGV